MIVVVDANVAVKWFVEEERRDLAREVLCDDGLTRIAPELIFTEVASALRKKTTAKEVSADQSRAALANLRDCFSRIVNSETTLMPAFEISLKLGHPLADCVYLACAMQNEATLVTDDRIFAEKCTKSVYGGFVHILGNPW